MPPKDEKPPRVERRRSATAATPGHSLKAVEGTDDRMRRYRQERDVSRQEIQTLNERHAAEDAARAAELAALRAQLEREAPQPHGDRDQHATTKLNKLLQAQNVEIVELAEELKQKLKVATHDVANARSESRRERAEITWSYS